MKITKRQLSRIIKEEIQNVLKEGWQDLVPKDIQRTIRRAAGAVLPKEFTNAIKEACEFQELVTMIFDNPSTIKMIIDQTDSATIAGALVEKATAQGVQVPPEATAVLVMVIDMLKSPQVIKFVQQAAANSAIKQAFKAGITMACSEEAPPTETPPQP